MYVACPNCRGWMVGDGIPVGAPVLCPHCQKQFVMTEAILAAAVQPEANRPVSGGPSGGAETAGAPPRGGGAAVSLGAGTQPTAQAGGTTLASATSLGPGGGAGAVPGGVPGGGVGPGTTVSPGGSGVPGGGLSAGGAILPGGPMAQMPPRSPTAMAGTIPQAGPVPGMAGGPVGMPAPPIQAGVYAQPAAPAAREPVRPRARPVLLSAEAILIIGFSLMIVAVILVALLGYGGRPAAENIGKPSVEAAIAPPKGPLMEVQYDLRRRIIYIENKDRSWQEAELRINPDPADDEGGYRCQLGEVPRGRKKPVLLDQCLSPSGARFQGDIQRIVVIAKTADGTLRYVSDLRPFSK